MIKIWNLWLKFDAFLIDKLENLTQKFQKITGKDNFWLCKIILIICSVIWFTGCLFGGVNVFYMIIYIAFLAWCSCNLYIVETTVKEDLPDGVANYAKIDLPDIIIRSTNFFIVLSGGVMVLTTTDYSADSSWILLYLTAILFLIFLYLEACDPLPPCKGKIKEWFQSLFFNLKPIEVKE